MLTTETTTTRRRANGITSHECKDCGRETARRCADCGRPLCTKCSFEDEDHDGKLCLECITK